jgi:hypothetical protein
MYGAILGTSLIKIADDINKELPRHGKFTSLFVALLHLFWHSLFKYVARKAIPSPPVAL